MGRYDKKIEEVLSNIRDENTKRDEVNDQITQEKIKYAVRLAGKRIYDLAQAEPEYRGMGTTAVILVFLNGMAYLAHVGDSRGYLIRGGEITQRTEDHSWVNEQVMAGYLSDEQARTHPLRNVVTRALGGEAEVEVDIREVPVQPGDIFVLCSDGLTGMLRDEEILALLRQQPDLQAACQSLIDAANARGGADNITVVLVAISPETE